MHVVGRGRRAGGVPVLRVPVLVRLAVAEVVAVVGAGVLVLVGVRMPVAVAVAVAVAVRGGDGRGAVLQELRVEVERAFQLEGLGGGRWGEPVFGATRGALLRPPRASKLLLLRGGRVRRNDTSPFSRLAGRWGAMLGGAGRRLSTSSKA